MKRYHVTAPNASLDRLAQLTEELSSQLKMLQHRLFMLDHPRPTARQLASAKAAQALIARAKRTAAEELQGPELEVEVYRSLDGDGWDVMQFFDSGGGWLAQNVSYPEAVRAASRFLREAMTGKHANLEIRIGHPKKWGQE